MNELMNERINEWMNRMNEWMVKWKNECRDGQIEQLIKWIDDRSLSNQMKNVNLYEIQLAWCDMRVPAGHAISKTSMPDSKIECLGHAGILWIKACLCVKG